MSPSDRPLVIGAGPGGLSVAWALKSVGHEPVVLEREDIPYSTWTTYYPSLRMNSWRRLCSLPGMKMPSEFGPWPMQRDFENYMRRYVEVLEPDVRYGEDVKRISREDGQWRVESSGGDTRASTVVVASGLHRTPFIPDWPGRERFGGELFHARDYRGPDKYVDRDVLVVGCGPTGIDIAIELARGGAGRVRMSIRTPPLLFPLSPVTSLLSQAVKHTGVPPGLVNRVSLAMHRRRWGSLASYGLGVPEDGLASALAKSGHTTGSIDRGLVSAVKTGAVEIVKGVTSLTDDSVVLSDDSAIQPDVVIAATGQRPELDDLVGHLGVIAPTGGRPLVHGKDTLPHAPNMYFQGYRVPSGQIPDMERDAWAIARDVAGINRLALARKRSLRASYEA